MLKEQFDSVDRGEGPEGLLMQPGTLWRRITQQTEHGLQCGALQPIPTRYRFVGQAGVTFMVRTLDNLQRKDREKKKRVQEKAVTGKDFNPFLPYDDDLFVSHISETHLALLNKFNVVAHHLLIVTRAFEAQDTWLTVQDFAALWACLAEYDGLAFYNGGQVAGASQRHKHLQLVPLPMVSGGNRIPIEPSIEMAEFMEGVGMIPSFPFRHGIVRLDPSWLTTPLESAPAVLACYYRLLQALGLEVTGQLQTGAYNLLATRDWMLIVPRSQEHFESISVNSLGFAGSLFVRDEGQMAQLQDYGPMNVLQQVAQPR